MDGVPKSLSFGSSATEKNGQLYHPCFIVNNNQTIRLTNIDLIWPPVTSPDATQGIAMFDGWGNNFNVQLNHCTITGAPSAPNNRYLVSTWGARAVDVRLNNTSYDAALADWLFQGVAAGGDPNANVAYTSNLTAL